jgi:serpin B
MDAAGIVEGGNRFALELYRGLRAGDANLIFSPSSISMALAMTYAGAKGTTRAEMAKTLHFPRIASELDDGMQKLLSQWKTTDKSAGYRLNLANRLWGQEGYAFLPRFLDITGTKYGAQLARIDFAEKTEESRKTINQWVEDQTEEKIKNLLPAGSLSRDSRLVLTNAVYFKGEWTKPFKTERTRDEDFHLTATEKVRTPLMHQQDDFRYAAVDGLQLLELPYGNKSLSMVILLPEEVEGLAQLEGKLKYEHLQRWTSALRSQEVVVYLPKFQTTASFELNGTLVEMGMRSAFDPQSADFSGMTGAKDLFISKAIHKAFVDVNEEGTEAAAATGIVMETTALPVERPKPVFRADHPFVFLIRDNRTGAILFLGRLVDPTG